MRGSTLAISRFRIRRCRTTSRGRYRGRAGITRIVIPPMPGTFSAFGLLTADTRYDVTQTRLTKLDDIDLAGLQEILAPMRTEARDRLLRWIQ